MNAVTQSFGPCPCNSDGTTFMGCNEMGTKLTRYGHLRGCTCRVCLGRRNKYKGRRSEAKTYKALGLPGQTKKDDLYFTASVDVAYENKSGGEIPVNFLRFIGLEWTRHALRQAEKKIPIGADALPSLVLDCGRKGMWMVTPIPAKGLR